MKIAIFTSGYGSQLKPIIDKVDSGELRNASVELLVDTDRSFVLNVTYGRRIQVVCYDIHLYRDPDKLGDLMLEKLREHEIEFIVLANYIKKLPEKVVKAYWKRAVNIHPALLPLYGGKGWYGKRVIEETLRNGDSETGVTVHYVSEEYDAGEIIAQVEVPVYPHDTHETLAGKLEYAGQEFYWQVIDRVLNGEP